MSHTSRKTSSRADVGPTYGRLSSHPILKDVKTNQRYVTNAYVHPGNYRRRTWYPVMPGTWQNKGYCVLMADMSKLKTSTTCMKGESIKNVPNYSRDRRAAIEKRKASAMKTTMSRKRKATPHETTTRKKTKSKTRPKKMLTLKQAMEKARKRHEKEQKKQTKK